MTNDAQQQPITRAALRELVGRFYAKARLDPDLGPVFEAAVTDWDVHLEHLTSFWSAVVLGERGFSGNPLAAHARHPIRPGMFARWLDLWGETAREVFDAETAAMLSGKAAHVAESLKLGLYFKAG
jgi:hemoglobin